MCDMGNDISVENLKKSIYVMTIYIRGQLG